MCPDFIFPRDSVLGSYSGKASSHFTHLSPHVLSVREKGAPRRTSVHFSPVRKPAQPAVQPVASLASVLAESEVLIDDKSHKMLWLYGYLNDGFKPERPLLTASDLSDIFQAINYRYIPENQNIIRLQKKRKLSTTPWFKPFWTDLNMLPTGCSASARVRSRLFRLKKSDSCVY